MGGVTKTWYPPETAAGSGGLDVEAGDDILASWADRVASALDYLGGATGNSKTGGYSVAGAVVVTPTTADAIGVDVAGTALVVASDVTGVYSRSTLTAAANNNGMQAIAVNPTFAKGAFTNLGAYGLLVYNGATTGAGTIANKYGVYVAAQSGGTNNYGLYTDGGKSVFGGGGNANSTQGLTLNQSTNDDEILSLKSSDVAHGVTTFTETDTFGRIRKIAGATGGLEIYGLAESAVEVGLYLGGVAGTDATGKASNSAAYAIVNGAKINGTGTQAPGAGANIFAVRSNDANKLIVDQEGDLYVDGSTSLTAFDHHDDAKIARAIRAILAPADSALRIAYASLVGAYAPVLAEAGIVTLNGDGPPFLNLKRLALFQLDGLFQHGERLAALEARWLRALPAGGD